MVICGFVELDNNCICVFNLILIVEIFFKGIRGFDKDCKFDFYCEIFFFKEYLLLDFEFIGFQLFFKEEGDLW